MDVAYPRAIQTDDPELETWRLRRKRRQRLFGAWMFGGLLVAIAAMLMLDAAQDQAWWLLGLIAIATLMVFLVRWGRVYGNARVDEIKSGDG